MANATKQSGIFADAERGAVQPRFGEVRIRQRGKLPHWEKEAGLYFVTFRLADSLPEQVLGKNLRALSRTRDGEAYRSESAAGSKSACRRIQPEED